MDGSVFGRVNWATFVNWLSNDVDDSAQSLGTDWNHDWIAGVFDLLSTHETLSGVQSNCAHVVATQVLGDL